MSKVAVVTGGARGIGAAIAVRLAADGRAVAIVDLADATPVVAAITAAGGTAAAFTADIADADAVGDTVAAIAERLGPPAILVNNAGVTRDALVHKMVAADWDTVLSVHLRGAFLMSQACQRAMVDQRWGRIVNISSTSALGNRGQANYSAAKAGLQGFTKTLAIELGPFGITVNCVAPGFVATEMTRDTARRLGREWADYAAERAAAIPVRRAGEPDDIAQAVSFFVDEAAGFTSGQVLYVAGGPRA
jgi:3-oxoacyl-[acyl-carrier protein] reductase